MVLETLKTRFAPVSTTKFLPSSEWPKPAADAVDRRPVPPATAAPVAATPSAPAPSTRRRVRRLLWVLKGVLRDGRILAYLYVMADDGNLQVVPSAPTPSWVGSLPLLLPLKRTQVLTFFFGSPWMRIFDSVAVSP